MKLVKEIYMTTKSFPKEEKYGLTAQMRRAAVAIPSNIVEGYLRKHKKEFIQFLSIALGSAAELETQVLICKSLKNYTDIDFKDTESLLVEVMKMLYVMIEKMKK